MPKSFRLWHAHLYMGVSLLETGVPLSFFYKHQKYTYDGKKPDFFGQLISAPSKSSEVDDVNAKILAAL